MDDAGPEMPHVLPDVVPELSHAATRGPLHLITLYIFMLSGSSNFESIYMVHGNTEHVNIGKTTPTNPQKIKHTQKYR